MGHPQLAWFHPRLLVARHADAATGAPLLTELALRRCRAPPPSTLNVILEGAEPVSPTTHVHLADFAVGAHATQHFGRGGLLAGMPEAEGLL